MRPLSARAAGLLAYVTLFAALVASSELPDGPGGQQEPTATTLVPAAATVCQDAQRGAPTKQFSGWPQGRDSEAVQTFLFLTEANALQMYGDAGRVLFCIIDSGVGELRDLANGTTGCVPGTSRGPGGAPRSCHPWDQDPTGTGTAIATTIGALKNGKGVRGVLPGAQIYSYHVHAYDTNSLGITDAGELQAALSDCAAEHDARKQGSPDLKLVIVSGVYLAASAGKPSGLQALLRSWAATRPDTLLVGAARGAELPAVLPEFLAVAGTDEAGAPVSSAAVARHASLAAPSTVLVELPTVPRRSATQESIYDSGSIEVPGIDLAANPSFFRTPAPFPPLESGRGTHTASVVDCGVAPTVCANATGKICLIQRCSVLTLAQKVENCVEGGGVAALVYNRDDKGACELTPSNLDVSESYISGVPWPVVLLLSRDQGRAIRQALAAQPDLTATVRYNGPPELDLGVVSDSRNAAAIVAGVAGLLWSTDAGRSCNAAQIRRALEATAMQTAGLPGTRNNRVGHGVVQGIDALDWLAANPCKPVTPTMTLLAAARSGSVTIMVQLRMPATLTAPPANVGLGGKAVSITASPAGALTCPKTTLTADASGRARVVCKVALDAAVTVTATAPASPWFERVSKQVALK